MGTVSSFEEFANQKNLLIAVRWDGTDIFLSSQKSLNGFIFFTAGMKGVFFAKVSGWTAISIRRNWDTTEKKTRVPAFFPQGLKKQCCREMAKQLN